MFSVVFMGVAGCGKSSAAEAVAQQMGWPLIEGDDYHAEASKAKMRQGIALTDDDRAAWLNVLGGLLAMHQRQGHQAALTCSALKRRYRNLLRSRNAGLRFVYLEIDKPHSLERVAARAGEHLFPPSLVDSQFATLEPPHGEVGVLCIDALLPRTEVASRVVSWIKEGT